MTLKQWAKGQKQQAKHAEREIARRVVWESESAEDYLTRALKLSALSRSRDTYELRQAAESLRELASVLDEQANAREALRTIESLSS